MAECRGFIVAATASGAGKTTVTLGLLKAFRELGYRLSSAKAGPDFIDPRFHEGICRRSCLTLDSWAMRPEVLDSLVIELSSDSDLCVVEGVMGLFDGAANGRGSTAELAKQLGLPIILIIDVRRQAQSAAAILKGFSTYDPECPITGVILNGIASDRHEYLLRQAIEPLAIPVLGALRYRSELGLPSRHLGLVQASEHEDFETFGNAAGAFITEKIDLNTLSDLAMPLTQSLCPGQPEPDTFGLRPLGQVIAVAQDAAFEFYYPHILRKWQAAGAEIIPFSPLADNPPSPHADAVYLPGGYPELYAAQLSSSSNFLNGLSQAAENDCLIYGECGGYMVLGDYLVDGRGEKFRMAGLLPVSTSLSPPRRQLGYRRLSHDTPLPWGRHLRGHEFHYASIIDKSADPCQDKTTGLFEAEDVEGQSLGKLGHRRGRVMGSFAHIIDQEHDDGGNASGQSRSPDRSVRSGQRQFKLKQGDPGP